MNTNEYNSNIVNIILKLKLPSYILNIIKDYWYDKKKVYLLKNNKYIKEYM